MQNDDGGGGRQPALAYATEIEFSFSLALYALHLLSTIHEI